MPVQEVAKCQITDSRLTLSDVCSTYNRLKKQCREEYVMYNLAAAALSQVSLGNSMRREEDATSYEVVP